MMHNWEAFDPHVLTPGRQITASFMQIGMRDYRASARYVAGLRYGRNSDCLDPLIVMREQRGSCSTKHALLRRLAIEQNLDITLFIGIFNMDGWNTPGIGHVLEKYRIASLPEAHCYLRFGSKRIDVTRQLDSGQAETLDGFLHEEEIAPEQIGNYKTALHQHFLRRWIGEGGMSGTRDFAEFWRIREECIAALGEVR